MMLENEYNRKLDGIPKKKLYLITLQTECELNIQNSVHHLFFIVCAFQTTSYEHEN